jgi:hypothetical protein
MRRVAGDGEVGRQVATTRAELTQEVPMPSDLAALTPPLLVAIAFLIAVSAFIRHEMRRGRNRADDEQGTDSEHDSSAESAANRPNPACPQRSFSEPAADRAQDPRDRDS